MSDVFVRAYLTTDALPTLSVFLDAIATTAAQDYSPEQVEAWAAPRERQLGAWNSAREHATTIVAIVGDSVAGFADIDGHGHIDMMFVHSRFGRRGVATALLADLHCRASATSADHLTTEASITARPFLSTTGSLFSPSRASSHKEWH